MKKLLIFLMILTAFSACRSKKEISSSFNKSNETYAEQASKVTRSVEASEVTTTQTQATSDTTHESLSDEGIEFETNSPVTYNAKTGEFTFIPKGKTKFNKKTQSKSTGHQASTDSTRNVKTVVAKTDSAGHSKTKAKIKDAGKAKDLQVKSNIESIAALFLIIVGIGLWVYKEFKG